jgi:hypothetical protein
VSSARAIARALRGTPSGGGGFICRCPLPSHDAGRGDHNPSLFIKDGYAGLLVHCHSGCSARDILAELRRRRLLADALTVSQRVRCSVARPRARKFNHLMIRRGWRETSEGNAGVHERTSRPGGVGGWVSILALHAEVLATWRARHDPNYELAPMGTCATWGKTPCGNPTFCGACRDADRRKARGERDRPRRRPTPQVTVETIMWAVRERGLAVLNEPANIERLSRCDADALAQIDTRLAELKGRSQ